MNRANSIACCSVFSPLLVSCNGVSPEERAGATRANAWYEAKQKRRSSTVRVEADDAFDSLRTLSFRPIDLFGSSRSAIQR